MKITEKIKMLVMGLAAVATLGTATLVAPTVGAVDSSSRPAATYTASGQEAATGDNRGLMQMINTIINGALGVIGIVAVVIIIFGGVQYTTSAGDAAKVTKAKNTILYGVVGLVIALLAFAIVNFVIANIIK